VSGIFLNLLVNSIFSLFAGLGLCFFFLWFFHVPTGRWKLFFLSLPFAKIVYDLALGVPRKSILFAGVDPLSLPAKHQRITIGLGWNGWVPELSTAFSTDALDGTRYNASIGDYLLFWLRRHLGASAPEILVWMVALVSFALIVRRLWHYGCFEWRRRREEKFALGLEAPAGIEVYGSGQVSGTPFTGGLLRPYICFPKDALGVLSADEVRAVLAHETGHVRSYDLWLTLVIQILGDALWFVPGYRWLSRRIDRLREILADRWAVASGAEPLHLAAALLKLRGLSVSQTGPVLYSAFFRETSLVKERVQRLLGDVQEVPPRFGWQNSWVRVTVAAFVSLAVLNAVFCGNDRSAPPPPNPAWFIRWLQHAGRG
jgi:Zn-dependent protease with chaperone function